VIQQRWNDWDKLEQRWPKTQKRQLEERLQAASGVRDHRLPSPPCFFFRICLCISAFCLDEKGCWQTSILCTLIHEFSYISHLCYLSILLSYLIFDFVCLTLSLADTRGIAKYARTYVQRYTHTHTQKPKKNKKRGKLAHRLAMHDIRILYEGRGEFVWVKLVWIGQILAWGPCAGKVNEILFGLTANTKPLHERHRCHIERRNDNTIGCECKSSTTVYQLQFHVNKTAKDSSPFAMRVGQCIFVGKAPPKSWHRLVQACLIWVVFKYYAQAKQDECSGRSAVSDIERDQQI